MDPIGWLESNEQYFTEEMNGYNSVPIGPYLSTLPLIDRDGGVMDLGCGNGMFLKFLMQFSNHKITPFGIDTCKKAISQAEQDVLPSFASNFEIGDVVDSQLPRGRYDIIVGNPFYAAPNIKEFTEKCLDSLNQDGRLIYRIHPDVLNHYGIENLDDISEFKELGGRTSEGYHVSFCVFER